MVSEVAYWTSRLSTVDMVCTDVEVDFCVGVEDRVVVNVVVLMVVLVVVIEVNVEADSLDKERLF